LLVNAINYTPSGGRVIVRTGKEELEDRLWAILRSPTPASASPPRNFPTSLIVSSGASGSGLRMSGTGLGLSIVKEIVDRHGVRATVESEVGKGSTFTVWLPVSEE
ncbi:MAG: ATP-binding protein, partial [Anaerolineae bacterium]|nr:ATP-binding protein [Anaerolineae bacterium]